MTNKTTRQLLIATIVALLVVIVAGAMYVGRLRWQYAFLRADTLPSCWPD